MAVEPGQPKRAKSDPPTWRYLAAVMCALQGLTLIFLLYYGWAFADNLRALKDAGGICFPFGSTGDESIKAAYMFGRLDVLTLFFAFVGILLAFFALIGFGIFRREVIAQAREVVADLVPDEVRDNVGRLYPQGGRSDGGNLFTPADVPYDRVEPENETNETTGSTGHHPEPPNGGSGSSGTNRLRSWFTGLRDKILGW